MDTSVPQAPEPGYRRRLPILLSAVLALAGLSALVYLSLAGRSHPAASAARPAAAATPAAPAAAPAPAAAAVPLSPKAAARVTAWKSGHGGTALAHVSGQLGNVTMAGSGGSFAVMRIACGNLGAAVASARADPPIPDAAMQKLYRKALADLAKATANCSAAITAKPDGVEDTEITENHALLARAESEFAAGAKELYRATAKIKVPGHG